MNKLISNNIHKSFKMGDDSLVVLNDINLTVNENESIAITGASGAGKSSFLHILAGLDKPSSGNIYFNDFNLSSLSNNRLSQIRLENFGFVYQFHYRLINVQFDLKILIEILLLLRSLLIDEVV